ncbi:MAG: pilus assembly protein PilC, type pilus assembly protein PilC [Candidatus Kaiserbacteria bacterium]|nr:pilus assembly protein PilC, type pilus assembly protein PilC [Candidatus Kaiserbacteria bacterium]
MSRFVYTAEKNDGEVYKGTAEAKDRFELYGVVRREGGKIISVNEQSGSKWSITYWNTKLTTIKEYDKILMARNLGAMISAGLSLSRSLAVLERQTKNPRLGATISEIASDVRRGETLHGAMAKFPRIFSNLFIAMLRAGEEGGDLPASLQVTSDQMERMFDLKKKIKGAMIYPCIILVAIFGIGIVMMIVVVPTLGSTFSEMGASLPSSTQFVINLSNFLVQYTVLALGMIVGVVVGLYLALRTRIGQRGVDFVLLHLPGISPLVKEVNAARTARTMASLLTSGVDVITALDITHEVVQNSYFQAIIAAAKTGVAQGQPLSTEFARNEKMYPPFVGEMMAVGEETGQTAEMLKRLALFYEVEVDRKTKDMSTIIEPFLMLFIGAAVGFFAVAMITPIYSLSSNNF